MERGERRTDVTDRDKLNRLARAAKRGVEDPEDHGCCETGLLGEV